MENRLYPSAVSVGKKLKEAREKKSLSVEQVQKQTKIHSTVLMALENGRASEILTDTYVRSFLKKYSQFVGISAVEILKEYFPPYTESSPTNISFHKNPLPRETTITPKILYMTGLVILGILAILILVLIGGKITSALKRPKITQQKTITVAAPKKIQKPVKKAAAKKKPAAKTKTETEEFVPKSAPLSLVIRVKEPVLVKLKKDGILLFERVLPRNLVETVTANNNIELDIGKARALELTLNGKTISLPGKNNILGLEITRKGIRIK